MVNAPNTILKKYWGYDEFRPGQIEIIQSILSRKDTLAIMPTGGGKSLCFQVPGLVLGGVTLVISPLISLMTDQVSHLERKGVKAVFLSSTLTSSEKDTALNNIKTGSCQFIYVAPERLQQPSFIELCEKLPISLVAIDEAHCCSEWGHDFRPSYLNIKHFVAKLPSQPVMAAFTATATPHTIKDIVQMLGLRQTVIFKGLSKRSNLFLSVYPCHNLAWQWWYLTYALKARAGGSPAIVYSATQSATEFYSKLLSGFLPELAFAAYHAGLPSKLKQNIQDSFLKNDIDVICATSAFGMGVDKPNIRQVLHTHPSLSIEAYVQEVGRAGRDGQPAHATLFHHPEAISTTKELLSNNRMKKKFKKLEQFIQQRNTCRHQFLSEYFGDTTSYAQNCTQCDICTQPYWQPSEKIREIYTKTAPLETPLTRHWQTLGNV